MTLLLRMLCLALLPAMGIVLGGCEGAGLLAEAIAGDQEIEVKAQYQGLQGQRVAVLVDADQSMLTRNPLIQFEICTVISRKIAENVEGVTLVSPRQVVDYQNRNSYWTTASYSKLASELKVTRLVLVELTEYSMHEPGNRYVLKGTIGANVAVAESTSGKPNELMYDTVVSATYPENQKVGLINRKEKDIRFATLDLFSNRAAGKFYDHTIKKEN